MIFISDKIEVKDSKINGKGVFAKSNILAGETIEICHFTILNKKFNQIDKKLQEYVFSWPKEKWGGDSVLFWGFGSIYNHSKIIMLIGKQTKKIKYLDFSQLGILLMVKRFVRIMVMRTKK